MTDQLDTAIVTPEEPDYPAIMGTAENPAPWPTPPTGRYPTGVEQLAELPPDGLAVPISIETRKMVVVDYSSIALSGATDGTGGVDIDLGRVPANQWWVIDQLVVRGTAAGGFLLYDAGQVGVLNDSDLLASGVLASPAFAGQVSLSGVYVKPGRQLLLRTIGAGNSSTVTVRVLYRIATLAFGEQEHRT